MTLAKGDSHEPYYKSFAYIYYLANPSQGANTVSITKTFGQHNIRAMSLSGVNLASPIGSTSEEADHALPVSMNITGVTTDSLLIDVMAFNGSGAGAPTPGAGQTVEYAGSSIRLSKQIWGISSKVASSSTENFSWSFSTDSTRSMAHVAVEIKKALLPPAITTGTVGNLFATSAGILGNEVTSAGDESVTERGVVVSTSTSPDITDTKAVVAGAVGSFDANLSGLDAETTYYARAFATSSVGTTYGAEVSFTTDINAAMPIMMADNPVNFNTPIIL